MNKQYYGDARRYAETILKYEPDNEAAKALLAEATAKENEEAESGEVAESTPIVEDQLSDFDKAVSENPDAVILSDGFLGPNILWNVEILEISDNIERVSDYVERHHDNAVSLVESGSKAGYISIYVKCRTTLIQSFTGLSYKFVTDDFLFLDSNDNKLDSMVIAENGFDEKLEIGDYTTGGFVVQVRTDEMPKMFLGDKELN